MRVKDLDKLVSLYAPDFRVRMETGEVWSRERSIAYSRAAFQQVAETQVINNKIVSLKECGDRTVATVLQQWYRTQTMAGKLRHVQTNAVQDETWMHTADGWKRGDIANIRQGIALIDGKPVDATRPYDPEAPAFDPNEANPPRPLATALQELIERDGVEPALRALPDLLRSDRFYRTETSLNALGYQLVERGSLDAAITIFRLNVSLYPQSANVYDSLGEAYERAGQRDAARQAYRRSLQLNPRNEHAAHAIGALETNEPSTTKAH
jgi:tetratricopeptide (TPR) repeat protein